MKINWKVINTVADILFPTYVFGCVMIIVLSGCFGQNTERSQPEPQKPTARSANYLDKYVDEELGIVCYRGDSQTLSCVKYTKTTQ